MTGLPLRSCPQPPGQGPGEAWGLPSLSFVFRGGAASGCAGPRRQPGLPRRTVRLRQARAGAAGTGRPAEAGRPCVRDAPRAEEAESRSGTDSVFKNSLFLKSQCESGFHFPCLTDENKVPQKS